MHLFLQSFIIRDKFFYMMNLEKNLVPFCNTEVLQESIMKLAQGFCILFHFRFRKCRECMQKEKREVNDLSWFLWVCRHYIQLSCYFTRENTKNPPHSYFVSAKAFSHHSQLDKETMGQAFPQKITCYPKELER